jgi:bifunctional non-homologous end joining protein LigD
MATKRTARKTRPARGRKAAAKRSQATTARRGAAKGAQGAQRSAATTARRSTRKSAERTTGSKTKRSAKSAAAKRTSTPAAKAAPLREYNAKRDFTRTAEPAGKVPKPRGKTLHFVIQKHAASHLHYDFRLELDGVMKSWAVPKGPSLDPTVRRLAMEVEDHPIAYNTFEGTIPQGEYGGGTVMLWDRGTYEAEDGGGIESLREGYARGDLKFVLHGERLRGGWVLVRMKRPGRPQWLLIKRRDRYADPDRDVTAEETTSVVSKRTMEQIANGRRVWHSSR